MNSQILFLLNKHKTQGKIIVHSLSALCVETEDKKEKKRFRLSFEFFKRNIFSSNHSMILLALTVSLAMYWSYPF
ncbi:hypothetical protein P3S68_030590 [Capsicum galapagoense]